MNLGLQGESGQEVAAQPQRPHPSGDKTHPPRTNGYAPRLACARTENINSWLCRALHQHFLILAFSGAFQKESLLSPIHRRRN